MRIDWDGAELHQLLDAPDGPVASQILETAGRAVEEAAKSAAPVRTGTLRESITHRLGSDDGGSYVDVIAAALDEKGRPRALFTEVGTDDTAAQPYLRPALNALRGL